MKLFYSLLVLGMFQVSLFSQSSNISFRGNWDGASVDYNDVWGYVDGAGREYAIIGSLTKIHVVNVTNPVAPTLVGEVTGGSSSIWRDFKTYGNYAYGVADQGGTLEGMYVINLSNLPTSISVAGQYTNIFHRAHNIFVDSQHGRLYVVGASKTVSGSSQAVGNIIIYDLTANPANPTHLATVSLAGGYIHDVYVRNHIAYASHGNNGLYVYNLATPNSPVFLGSLTSYPEQGYNHSGWLNDNGTRYVFADETHGKSLKIADVSNLNDITVTTSNLFKSCLLAPSNNNCIAHNPFILGNHVFVSYYHDGVAIFDITNPNAVVKSGYYDTFLPNTNYNSFFGAWGAYPYLPSGNLLVSDDATGLYILNPAMALPVELAGFTAKREKQTVHLNWLTHSEQFNDRFEVERSADGRLFKVIGTVKGKGNTSDRQFYNFEDRQAPKGTSYYRLRQVDFDGSSEYSEVLAIDMPGAAGVTVTPSVLTNETASVQLQFDEPTLEETIYEWYDLSGRVVATGVISPDVQQIHVPVPTNTTGMLVLVTTNELGKSVHKLLRP